ncbi:hypothetical protein LMH73_010230 [Vibrio splendidus]|nr:hypothetical protein [Vibrio splendidus]MCC4882960.1 hypothetical protein [Vibrio splendidus]
MSEHSIHDMSDDELEALYAFHEEKEKENQLKLHEVQYRVHGHTFLRDCRLPMYWLASLRRMKVGDTFIMGSIRNYYDELGYEGVGEIYATKGSKGVYTLSSNWTLASKPTRAHRFSLLTFKIEKGGFLAFTKSYTPENVRSFKLTSRYIQRLIDHVISDEEKKVYSDLGMPAFLSGVNIDKNQLTTRNHYVRHSNGRDLIPKCYHFSDEQMPKGMMECLVDCAGAMGIFGAPEENPFNKGER